MKGARKSGRGKGSRIPKRPSRKPSRGLYISPAQLQALANQAAAIDRANIVTGAPLGTMPPSKEGDSR